MADLLQNMISEKELGKLGTITLTEKKVYQEVNVGSNKTVQVIPLVNVDSYGLISTQKIWLLILGAIFAVIGLVLLTQNSAFGAIVLIAIACLMIAGWWFTKKVGGVVYSMSGESKLFTVVSGNQLDEVVGFLNKLQSAVEMAHGSQQPSNSI